MCPTSDEGKGVLQSDMMSLWFWSFGLEGVGVVNAAMVL